MSKRSLQSSPAKPVPVAPRAVPRWLIGLAIFAVVLAVYWPALRGTMLWDDAGHVTRADLRSAQGLWRIWFEPGATQQYYPLLHSVFWLEHHLWGDATTGYHFINVVWHSLAAFLFGVLLLRLAIPGAWLAAFIFALHPVCVESVAWISEQKNTLSLVFYLCAALAYLRFETDRRPARYAIATLWFLAALCTKTVTATLPAALLVVQWWRRGKLTHRDILSVLPWFALSAIGAVVTATFEHKFIGARGEDFALSLAERGLIAGRVFWFYLGKLFWPADLMFMYPRWKLDAAAAWQWIFPVGVVALIASLVFARKRGLLAATLLFLGSLFPALGFVNVYPFVFSFVADHFQYLASLGIIAVVARGIVEFIPRLPAWGGRSVIAGLLLLLGVLACRQSATYRDPFTLYEATLAKNPDSWMVHNNLATALTDAGRIAEAVPHVKRALELRPNFPEAHHNFAEDLKALGQPADAIPHFEAALRLQPNFADARNGYALALMALGRTADGITQFDETIKRHPRFAMARFNLGLALAQGGRTAEAATQFAEAVKIQPDFTDAELQCAISLTLLDRLSEAMPRFEHVLQLEPEAPELHHAYARALAQGGRFDDAISHERQAVSLNPGFADAHLFLARLLQQIGRSAEAEQHAAIARQLGR